MSDYATQLREKQKLKYIYGILEKQLQKIFELASKNPAATGTALLSLLERRLDNVVYRASFSLTRASARQLVRHEHYLVNGKRMNIPSYTVKVGDVITMKKSKTAKIPQVAAAIEEERPVPNWLEVKGTSIKVVKLPVREDIVEKIDEQLIVEYYNR